MPTYMVSCYECRKEHSTYLPYEDLDAEQLRQIKKGAEFQVYEHNLPKGFEPEASQAEDLSEDGSFTDSEDYRQVCPECGSDYTYDKEGNRIDD